MLIRAKYNTEKFVDKRVSQKLADQMQKAGFFDNYNAKFGYIEGDVHKYNFEFRGKKYKVEFFSGSFYPYLLELI